jgi:hypothetical protein
MDMENELILSYGENNNERERWSALELMKNGFGMKMVQWHAEQGPKNEG